MTNTTKGTFTYEKTDSPAANIYKDEALPRYARAIIETTATPTVVLDKELKIIYATGSFHRIWDTTPEQLNGTPFFNLPGYPGFNPVLQQMLGTLIVEQAVVDGFEFVSNDPFGQKYFRINARSYRGIDPDPILVVTINDITDWCNEKSSLEKSNKDLQEQIAWTTESARLGSWEMDIATGNIVWDHRCSEFFGTDKVSLRYDDFLQALHPEDRGGLDEHMKKITAGEYKDFYNIEYRTCFKNTEETNWLRTSGKAFFDKNGHVARLAGTVCDITRQKLDEQLLRESEERFRVAADAAAVLMWLSTPYKTRNYFNKSWMNFTRRSFEQENGDGWKENIHPDDLELYVRLFESNFDQRKEYRVEYRLQRHDLEYRWVSETSAPRFSPEGIFEGYIGTCMDIHDQKMTREDLEKLVAERTRMLSNAVYNLEASNQNLEEFAYVASHDLQEPLRKIQAFAARLQLKKQQEMSDETRVYLSRITSASERMSRLIGDLLNYSKLKNTHDALEITDLNEVIKNVLQDFELTIQQRKAEINFGRLPVINAMPMRMNQLFHNLLSNALKFTKSDSHPVINIYSRELQDHEMSKFPTLDKSNSYEVITFADNGIGFNQEFAEKVFNIFQRLNGTSDYEGTGIGLAICRKIVLNHHGLIFARSIENKGTKFHIILPVTALPQQ